MPPVCCDAYDWWAGMDLSRLPAGLRWCYEWLVTLIGAVFFVSAGLLLSLLGLILRPFLTRSQAHWCGRHGMHYGSRLFFAVLRLSGIVHVDFSELDRLRHERGLIITPNHPCLMDALFVTSRLPNVVCVMKGSVLHNPVFYGCAELGGFIRSDTPLRFVQQCKDALQEGAQLLLFPEGTRTVSGTINPFKGGFALLARQTGAPVQTVFIEANTPFLGKKWRIWQKPDFPLIYRATLGKRLQVGKDQDLKEFTSDLENYFRNHLYNSSLPVSTKPMRR